MNRRKRLVKMPKLYFYDTGLASRLLGVREPEQLRTHPLRGSLFETWVVSEVLNPRQLVLRVVRVLGGAAMWEYRLHTDGPAAGS